MSRSFFADTTASDVQRSNATLVPELGGELGGLGDAIAGSGLAGGLIPSLPPMGVDSPTELEGDSLFPLTSESQSPSPSDPNPTDSNEVGLDLDALTGAASIGSEARESSVVSPGASTSVQWVPDAPLPLVPATPTPAADSDDVGVSSEPASGEPAVSDDAADDPIASSEVSPDETEHFSSDSTSDTSISNSGPEETSNPVPVPVDVPDLTARPPLANYQGELTDLDDYNPQRFASIKDDYILTVGEDSTIQFDLTSPHFDPYLQLLRVGSDEIFAFDDDSGQARNSQLTLNVTEGDRFVVRVTSYGEEETGNYRLTLISDGENFISPSDNGVNDDAGTPDTGDSDPSEPPETPATPLVDGNIQPDPEQFRSDSGYGLVNAAAAVAAALNLSQPERNLPFEAVPDLGQSERSLDSLQVPEVWSQGFTGRGVTVAVVDSGLDISHPEIQDSIWVNTGEIAGDGIDNDQNGYVDDVNGWNFGRGQLNNQIVPGTDSPFQGHGTHVAGIIANANDGNGNTGVAYDAKIMALRLGDTNSSGRFRNSGNLPNAVRYAVDNGADVVNLSLGWSDSPALRSALQYAAENNVIVVAASGNSGSALPVSPARHAINWGLSVGAVTASSQLATFSNRAGTNPNFRHVLAPGNRIISSEPGGNYGSRTGTSMAAPYVSGVVALMLSANPNLTHAQVRDILTGTATQLAV